MTSEPRLHAAEVLSESSGAGWNQEFGRVRVSGGWLYTLQVNAVRGIAVTSSFVPDGEPRPVPPYRPLRVTNPEGSL